MAGSRGPSSYIDPREPFRVESVCEGKTVRVVPIGELDMGTAPQLQTELEAQLRSGLGPVILDLRELAFIDSTGLHIAIQAAKIAKKDGVSFGIMQGPPEVRRVFEVAGIHESLPFLDATTGTVAEEVV